VRFPPNASTFYLKRLYVLLQTQVHLNPNVKAFSGKHKDIFEAPFSGSDLLSFVNFLVSELTYLRSQIKETEKKHERQY